MNKNKYGFLAVILLSFASFATQARAPQGLSHIHGIGFGNSGDSVLLGTHNGVFELQSDGSHQRISDNTDDYMSFLPHPSASGVFFGSGHPVKGGNLGLIKSTDAGASWQLVSKGLNGPVDFHKMAVSPVNSNIIIGEHGKLQRTENSGESWKSIGRLPENVYSFSISSQDSHRLYAAGDAGLLVSNNDGLSWNLLDNINLPSTLIQVTPDGRILAFVAGQGLVTRMEDDTEWTGLFDGFGQHIPLNLVWEPNNTDHLLVRDQVDSLWESVDGGKTWSYFLNAPVLSKVESQGKVLFDANCAQCHQAEGVGESYSFESLTTQDFIMAPSLDFLGHGWHHSDEQLIDIINNSTPRVSRMPKWKDTLSLSEIESVISYIKTLWTERELGCQGPAHMNCM